MQRRTPCEGGQGQGSGRGEKGERRVPQEGRAKRSRDALFGESLDVDFGHSSKGEERLPEGREVVELEKHLL
jgi:hypothetical protein